VAWQLSKLEIGLKEVREKLEAFEARQMKIDGGPSHHWQLPPSS
jgi:hypothetical protein